MRGRGQETTVWESTCQVDQNYQSRDNSEPTDQRPMGRRLYCESKRYAWTGLYPSNLTQLHRREKVESQAGSTCKTNTPPSNLKEGLSSQVWSTNKCHPVNNTEDMGYIFTLDWIGLLWGYLVVCLFYRWTLLGFPLFLFCVTGSD